MDDIWLDKVITVSGDEAYEFSVLCRELPASSSDLTRRTPLAYLFDDTRQLNSPPNEKYTVRVWDDFADPRMNDRMKEIHRAAIRYGLSGISTDPSVSDLNLDLSSYEQWCNRPQLRGEALRYSILRFVYVVYLVVPSLGISAFDLLDNLNASKDDIEAFLNDLVGEGLLSRGRFKRYWHERGQVNAHPFLINPKQRDKVRELVSLGMQSQTKESSETRAFLSYRTLDKHLAGQIKSELEKHGLRVFLAHEDIKPSIEWIEKILIELSRCDIFLPLLTDSFRGSEYTDQEAGIAFAGKKVILPLKVTQNPHGFIERYQALTVIPDNVALSCKELVHFLSEQYGFKSALDTDQRSQ